MYSEVLKCNMPDQIGEASGWNFERAQSIMLKVCMIYSDIWLLYNMLSSRLKKSSCLAGQNASVLKGLNSEHCHIEFCNNLAACTVYQQLGNKTFSSLSCGGMMIHLFSSQNSLFTHHQFYTLAFSMKMAESGKVVLVSCIIDFDDVQVWLKQFSLNLKLNLSVGKLS